MSFFRPRTSDKTAVAPTKVPWTEKYRPKSLKDVAAQESIVSVLEKTVHSDNLPHMLFYGPPGTGKTSTILALAKDLYGPELFKSRVLELNASDDRGISVVRDKIKNFSRTVVSAASDSTREKYPAPNFKLVILDEADMMTQDAQAALRRTMETYSKLTRFCLVCNYVTRIIDPLASRCSKFRFKELAAESASDRLEYICEREGVKLASSEVIPHLLSVSQGDLRRCITLLQSAAGLALPETGVTTDLISELSGSVPPAVVDELVSAIQEGNQRQLETRVKNIILEGFSVAQLVDQLHDILLNDLSISETAKNFTASVLSDADRRLTDGADEHLELLNVATQISLAVR